MTTVWWALRSYCLCFCVYWERQQVNVHECVYIMYGCVFQNFKLQ